MRFPTEVWGEVKAYLIDWRKVHRVKFARTVALLGRLSAQWLSICPTLIVGYYYSDHQDVSITLNFYFGYYKQLQRHWEVELAEDFMASFLTGSTDQRLKMRDLCEFAYEAL